MGRRKRGKPSRTDKAVNQQSLTPQEEDALRATASTAYALTGSQEQ